MPSPADLHYFLNLGRVFISDRPLPCLREIDALDALDLVAQGYPKFHL